MRMIKEKVNHIMITTEEEDHQDTTSTININTAYNNTMAMRDRVVHKDIKRIIDTNKKAVMLTITLIKVIIIMMIMMIQSSTRPSRYTTITRGTTAKPGQSDTPAITDSAGDDECNHVDSSE